jgi:hypothetical protein
MSVTVGHVPAVIHLAIYQGDDFGFALDVQDAAGSPVDLTGSTATAQMRKTPNDPAVVATFAVTVDGSTITLRLSDTETAALPAAGGMWDVQVVRADGIVTTLAAGQARVYADVTRAAATGGVR